MLQPSPDLSREFEADLLACRALLRNGSKSFFAASFLLPGSVRTPATALYAFCRLADDAVDGAGAAPDSIATLNYRVHRAYCGDPWPIAADRAFARVVRDHQIPRAIPEALIEGLAWDNAGRRYETIEDLYGYAARVAGSVGVMLTLVMGVRSPELLARACDLGIAMQLTNIARDVGEDAAAGRIYLPLSWMREAGLDPEAWLASPRFNAAIAGLTKRLLAVADDFYRRADAGIAGLPARCRPGIRAARLIYAEIGHELMRNGSDSVTRRAVVPKERKLALLAEALLSSKADTALRDLPNIPAARFLTDAVDEFEPPAEVPAWWDINGQAVRLITIWERLERRERAVL